jgi:hypothetical protein
VDEIITHIPRPMDSLRKRIMLHQIHAQGMELPTHIQRHRRRDRHPAAPANSAQSAENFSIVII